MRLVLARLVMTIVRLSSALQRVLELEIRTMESVSSSEIARETAYQSRRPKNINAQNVELLDCNVEN
jgi:hypothetical protein